MAKTYAKKDQAGVPTGGATGQVLIKNTGTDFDYDWGAASGGSGTVTSVGGTGTVNGLTLTGTVTTSGNLTLGGTLSGIANSALANSSLTIGSTNIALGGTSTILDGLTSVTSTTFVGALTGTASGNEVPLTISTGLTRATNTITNNLSTGIAGGQSIIGGTASGNNLTLSSTSNATKGAIIFGDSEYDELNNRLGLGTLTPTAKLDIQGTTASDLPTFGAELLSASGWTSTNWTGSFGAGWTHTVGNTTALTNTLAAINATRYQIAYTVTGRTAGSFTVTFGGVTSAGITATGAFGPTTTSTGTLSLNPTTDFDGTVVISIRLVSGVSTPIQQFRLSAGTLSGEIRANSVTNLFFGLNNGRFSTTGTNNTGFGQNSLTQVSTGSSNTAIGLSALAAVSTGNTNVALGANTLSVLTTGSNNMGVGSQSMNGLTTGAGNIGIGLNSLFAVVTGSSNVAIGTQAGRSLTLAAATNTFIGDSAGFNGSQLASATNSMALGNGTFTTASNQVVIGNTSVTSIGLGMVPATTVKLDLSDTVLAGSGALAGTVLNLAQTWNTSGSPTSIRLNVTNTASGANANLMDLQIASTSVFRVSKGGNVVTTGPVRLRGYTVATLPAGTIGDTAYVTDAFSVGYLVTAVGGGSTVAPVFYNGTNWVLA